MITSIDLTPEQLHNLQHALGHDKYGRGGGYRNHFVTDSTSRDGIICEELCAAGLMTRGRPPSEITGGDQCYHVTKAGEQAVFENSPEPPRMTRSQKSYQKYLDADCGGSFAEWIGAKRERGPVYFLQNVGAGYIGNSPLFWKANDCGYTPVISEAKKFTSAEADAAIRGSRGSHEFKRRKIKDVMKAAVMVCDIQLLEKQ